MPITHHSTEIEALIKEANRARLLSWYGLEEKRAAHAAHADALIEQLRRISVEWSKETRGC